MKLTCNLFLVLLFTSGCAGTKVWYQPGKTPAQAHQDLGECRMEAARTPVTTTRQLSGLGMFFNQQMEHGNFIEACMIAKGYQPTSVRSITNGTQFPKK